MTNDPIDLLQIKIEKARSQLPAETINAISAVDWRAAILGMRQKKGYTFEQLGSLELETELLLCGLVSPKEYPKELEKRMGIGRSRVDELVNEMNQSVFDKIREEIIKNAERKKIFANRIVTPYLEKNSPLPNPSPSQSAMERGEEVRVPSSLEWSGAGVKKTEETLPLPEKLEIETHPVRSPESSQGTPTSNGTHPILAQKLSGSFQIPSKKTDHSLENITKTATPTPVPLKVDPYREIPE